MDRKSLDAVFGALNEANVRYLVAGGLAVVAHGHFRMTADVDVILDLEPENLRKALEILDRLGYRPHAPVALSEFADESKRARWIAEKKMMVFSLFSDRHPMTEIDIFSEPPFSFAQAYRRATKVALLPGLRVSVVGLDDLLELKRRAGRPKDLEDIRALETLRKKGPHEKG